VTEGVSPIEVLKQALTGPLAGSLSEQDEVEIRCKILRSHLLTPDQLDKLPPPEPLIEGYCTRNTVMTTIGRPGTAKSLIVMSMSFSIVSGQTFFGHSVCHGPVLYIAAEGSAGLAQRQRAWREISGPALDGGWPALDGMQWLPMSVNLLDPAWAGAAARLVQELQPVFVVIDTVARSMPGGDENGSTDMGALVAAADGIREAAGCTVNLVHHTPRDGTTPRGHSALEGAVDTILLLERKGAQITLTAPKQKDLPTPQPQVFELRQVGSSVVLVSTTLPKTLPSGPDLSAEQRNVRDLVWQSFGNDGLATGVLLKMSGLSPSSFYRTLKVLLTKRVLRNVGTEKKPRYVAGEEVLPETLPTLPNASSPVLAVTKTLTANNPPLGGWQ
jgi:hypothetical protein